MVITRSTRKAGAVTKKRTAAPAGKPRKTERAVASAGKPRKTERTVAAAGKPRRTERTVAIAGKPRRIERTTASAGKPRKTEGTTVSTGKLHKTERKVMPRRRQPREMPKTGLEDGLIRLNKYIASTGLCSRREADEYIQAGLVTVNGKLITEMGVKISSEDVVKYNGETLREEKKVYILINKPKDYVTTVEDPHAKKTVLDLVKGACKERIYPVGRLDRNTTGVLLLTNDGELTKRLTHPKFEKLKIYHVHLNKGLKASDLEKIATGITLDDGFIKADAISYTDPVDKSEVGIEIHSGRNHIVRRIFESLGYEVIKLDRVYFAGLTKKNLHRGEWRFLSEREVGMLKMNAFK